MHDCTSPGSQSVVATCSLVTEILVVVKRDTGNAAFYHITAHAVQIPLPLLPLTTRHNTNMHTTHNNFQGWQVGYITELHH